MASLLELLWGALPAENTYAYVAFIAALIMLPTIAIVYMIGKVVGSNRLMGWSRDELYQLFGSVFIVFFVFIFLQMASLVILNSLGAAGFQCQSNGCTFEYEQMDIYGVPKMLTATCTNSLEYPCQLALAKAAVNAKYDLIRFYTADQMSWNGFIGVVSGSAVSLGPQYAFIKKVIGNFGITVTPLAGLGFVGDLYDNMLDILYVILLLVKANWIMLELTQSSLFPYFFIAGIVLRAIPLTRRAGGLLIAIALVLFFVFPMITILTSMLISPDPNVFIVDYGFVYGSAPQNTPTILDLVNDITVQVAEGRTDLASYAISKPILRFKLDQDNKLIPGGIVDTTAFMSVWILFQQIVIIYTVLVSIINLSPFFGGDVDIAGLSRLI